jgi:hypothetical protein
MIYKITSSNIDNSEISINVCKEQNWYVDGICTKKQKS